MKGIATGLYELGLWLKNRNQYDKAEVVAHASQEHTDPIEERAQELLTLSSEVLTWWGAKALARAENEIGTEFARLYYSRAAALFGLSQVRAQMEQAESPAIPSEFEN